MSNRSRDLDDALYSARRPDGGSSAAARGKSNCDGGDGRSAFSRPDRPVAADTYLHLYFGFDGRVPVGIDTTFPVRQTATAVEHLRWAEILIDAGLFYQAQQQLDLLGPATERLATGNWLRARLEVTRYRNFFERSGRVPDAEDYSFEYQRDAREKIQHLLDAAVRQEPDHGPAWLLTAEVALGLFGMADATRALEAAHKAQQLLGETPAVLIALGQALLEVDRPADAASVLRRIPEGSEAWSRSRTDLRRAEFLVQSGSDVATPDALLDLGLLRQREGRRDEARELFTQMVKQHPTRAEGHYGLAWLAFLNCEYGEAHRLCQEAMGHDPQFGRAHELVGSIFHNLQRTWERYASLPVEDPVPHFRRALEFDPNCDTALWLLAEDHLYNRRELQPALEKLERAAAMETDNSSVYFLLATIYMGTRQFEKMTEAHQRAKELSPHTELSREYTEQILRLCDFEY